MKKNIFASYLEELENNKLGISLRKILIMKKEVFIVYIQQLTDRNNLSENIIKPIVDRGTSDILSIEKISKSVIYADDIFTECDGSKIIDYALQGKSVIILSDDNKYIVANTTKVEKRTTQSPAIESTLRGPKDAFTENFDSNLSLIRYRLKDPKLRIETSSVGKRTKTNIAVIYIQDVVNKKFVNQITKKLESINIDGILESGYLQKFILNDSLNLFPQVGIVERSDTACQDILEGKIIIIIEGSNLALVAPKTLIEFLDAGDDHYDNIYLSIFSKFLRITCLNISLFASALYVAVVSFHPDILPPQYILSLAISRATVPFNAILEAFLMEFVAEILREASIRLPTQIGPTIGIVGAIVIGQAAVSAGLVSPLMVIIVALSTMCSFVAADYTIMTPIRILKFFIIIFTGTFGLFGFVIAIILISLNLCSITSLGVPYVSSLSPFSGQDIMHYLFSDVSLAKKRPTFLRTDDKTRK